MVAGMQQDPLVGRTIGGCTIRSVIGAGGMGAVYLAQQENPSRMVAVKVMNPWMVTGNALRRFEIEAQTLGQLQHPGIAQVFEAGTFEDDSGIRPYYAMEHVSSGKTLSTYVAENKLDRQTRLELFRTICEGVEYGHRRGVIHRDLKPDNILVDAEGHPKIIDYGVACRTAADETTLVTEAGQLVGTLKYMSPEQVVLDSTDLDTRSDVYALGVILYELLAGEPPYDVSGTSITEATSRIRETPPRDLREINPTLKGDLNAICLKALEKDRDKRYQSVADFSEDLRRFLVDEPILAKPQTRGQQVQRLVRKHKAATAASVIVVLILVAATTVSIVFGVEATKKARIAQAYAEFLSGGLSSMDSVEIGGKFKADLLDEARKSLLREGLSRDEIALRMTAIESMLAAVNFTNIANRHITEVILEPMIGGIDEIFADVPQTQGMMLRKVAHQLYTLGQLQIAEESSRRAVELLGQELGSTHPQTLFARSSLAMVLYRSSQWNEAALIFQELLPLYREIYGPDHINTLEILDANGVMLISSGQEEEGLQLVGESLKARQRLYGEEDERTLWVMDNYAGCLTRLDRDAEAAEYARRAWNTWRRLRGDENTETLKAQTVLAAILARLERFDEAEELLRPVLPELRHQLGDHHRATLNAMQFLGTAIASQERYDEAEPLLLEQMQLSLDALGADDIDTFNSRDGLVDFYIKQQRFAEAAPLARANARSLYAAEGLQRIEAIRTLAELHEAWHESEPNAGHDAKAAEYLAQIEAIEGRKPDKADAVDTAVP